MSKLKVTLSLLLVIVVALALAACSDKNKPTDGNKEPDKSKVTSTGLPADTINNEKFKDKFPEQYAGYQATKDDTKDTKYAGSQPRSKFSADKEPLLPILFNGMPFALDYNEDRGHAYALEDVYKTLRITEKSPGGCLSCKTTAVPALVEKNGDNYWKGGSWGAMKAEAEAMGATDGNKHSAIGCSTCHNPETMELRVTVPMFKNGLEDKTGKEVDFSKSTKDEMRSYVCGQCHSEYYFAKSNNEATFPWKNGFTGTDMMELYNTSVKDSGFVQDFESNLSKTPMLKAQHPDFETWSEGPHAGKASCADCHMQTLEDGTSNHQLQSPLKTVEASCSPCHDDAAERKGKVEKIQDTYKAALDKAQEESVNAHYYVNKMIQVTADPAKIQDAQLNIRNGQWLWDYCAAENSTGFHNPTGSLDNLSKSYEFSSKAVQIATEELVKNGVNLDELKAEITKAEAAVKAETDTTKKKNHAVGADSYFKPLQTPAPVTPAPTTPTTPAK